MAATGQLSIARGPRVDLLKDKDINRMSSMGRLAHLWLVGRFSRGVGPAAPGGVSAGVPEDQDVGAGGHAQPSIAVDSTGQHIVIGSNDAEGFGLNPTSVSGFKYSDDGGITFTEGGPLPITTPTSVIGATMYPQVFGDPDVKYLGGSTFIYFSIVVVNAGLGGPAQTLGYHRSTDYGHTWTGPFEIPSATNPNGLFNGQSIDTADKPFADVDSDTGRVLVSWSNFTPFALGGVEISTTFTDNILAANPIWSTRSVVAATAIDGQASIPRFVGNGSSNVYLAWERFSEDNADSIGFAKSTDNGVTWSSPINVPSSPFFTMDQALGVDRVMSSPGMAIDNSASPNSRNIYVVYSSNNLRDGGDIVFQRSTDGGSSFTAPILINSRPGNDREQWFPWVTVDNASGRVYVFYYDQGIDTSGDLTQTSYQFSDDGGLSWKQPMPLTDRPFKAGWGKDTGHPNLGDYNQAIAQNGEFFAAWAGTQLLPFTNGVPSIHMETPSVVFKRVSGGAAKVSLTSNFSGTTFIDDGGSGFIDAGEQIRFKFPLTNYVTNPISNPGVITGIVATLSATTSTVSIVQGVSGYPSMAPGASATNDTDFIVQLASSYVPGTPLDLVLNVTSNQGSTILLFTGATGTPRPTTIFQENFDSTVPGTLPAGWLTQHVGGINTVAWTTGNTFNAGNNGAFHINANDGVLGNSARWERLLSPLIAVPATSEYVTLDFDVKSDTQDDPDFNILAYDGFLLRIGDYGPSSSPSFVRAVMAEAFDEDFTTGSLKHYPKHFPRSNNPAYFQDLSAWAGASAGLSHVHMKLRGMAGRSIRLWWEFTQDEAMTCRDVRPAAPACGVLFDNLVVRSVVSAQADVSVTKSITSGPAISGQTITYAIDAVNNGPVMDVDSTVTDNLPAVLNFVSCSATGGGTCSGSGNNRSIVLPPSSPGHQTITLVAAISCSAAGGTSLSNTATIASPLPDPDSSNNVSTVSTTIVNPLPAMSCPADIVTTAQAGQTSAIANYVVNATDNCPLPPNAVVATPASGSAFPVGTTRVTATATDSGGGASSCGFNVTVNAPTTTQVTPITGQYGGLVTLTATVSPTPLAGQTATGTVDFFVDGTLVGSSAINASGVAVLSYRIVQVPGTYPVAANYVSTSPSFLNSAGAGQLTVVRAPASVTPNAAGKIYGSADPVLTGTLSGFVASDNVTAVFSRTPGETVGSYTISAALAPASVLGNYTITYNTASFLIAPLAASVTPNPASKAFGDPDPSPLTTGTLQGFLAADNVTASLSRTAGETPGQYPISASLSPENVLGNYAITYRTANFTINKYGLNVCDPNNHCTGGTTPNDNGIGGRLTLTAPATPGGTATAAVTLSPATVNNRDTLTSPGMDPNNQPLPPVFKVWLAPAADPTHPVLFGTGTAVRTAPDASGNTAWSATITATLAELPIVPGNYRAYVFGDDGAQITNNQVANDAGYGLADTTDFLYPTLSAPLTVTETSTTLSMNAPGVTYKENAIVTVAVASPVATPRGSVSLTVDAGTPLSATLVNGSAAFTVPGLNAGDHSLSAAYAAQGDFGASSATATLHVNTRAIQVTADTKSKTYGDADPGLSYRITSGSLATGDSFTGSLQRDSGETVGSYAIRQGTLALSSNYVLTYTDSSLTIGPKPASVSPAPAGKTYGSADPVLTGTLSGFVASDNVTTVFSRTPGETVGSYTISAALAPASVLGNYTITYNTASFLIAPLAASVTPNPASKTFGDPDPSPLTTGTLQGFLAADNVTTSFSRTAGETPGQYPISASLSPENVLGNYAITYRTANFTINKYGLNVCDPNNHCTGGTMPNDNGVGGRLTLTAPATPGGTATAVVTLSPATVNNRDTLTSPGMDPNNQPLPPVFKVWLAPAADPTHPVLFGTGTAVRTAPDASGNTAWSATITATLAELPIVPGNYRAYVFGDDGAQITNNQVANDAGYGLADTADFLYPTLSAPLTVASASTTVSINGPAVTYKDNAIVTVAVTSPAATPRGTVSLTVNAGMTLSATLSNGSATFAIPGSNAGDYSLNASYAAQGVFAAGSATADLHVNPRPIVITADAKSKTAGDPDPVLTYRITSGSLVNGDTFTGSLVRDAGETVGTYAIRQGTLALGGNYILNYAGANLTILPEPTVFATFSLVGGTFATNAGGLAVVTDKGRRSVSLPAGEVPGLTAASPDGSRLYVGFSASSGYSVHVIDTSDNHIVTTARICSNTSTVSCAGGNGLSATNAGTYVSFSTISGGLFINGGGLAFVNDGGGLPLNLPVGEIPELTAASPDGRRIYVGFSTLSGYGVHVIDTSDNHIVTTARICDNSSSISCEGGNGLAATNTGAYASFSTNSGALVANGGGLVFVNDGAGRPVTLPAGEVPGLTAASPDGSRLYVGFSTSSGYSVHIIDTTDNHIVTTAKVCSNTSSISCEGGNGLAATNTGAYASFSTNSGAFVINGGGLAFVNNSGSRSVSLPAGEIPELTAASPDGSRLYVSFSAAWDYSVHVIDTSDNHILTTAQVCSNSSCRAGNGLSTALTASVTVTTISPQTALVKAR
jgi:uncharacterized repeat protein (TIGR01451 family)